MMVEKGAKINFVDIDKKSALFYATEKGISDNMDFERREIDCRSVESWKFTVNIYLVKRFDFLFNS